MINKFNLKKKLIFVYNLKYEIKKPADKTENIIINLFDDNCLESLQPSE